MKSALIIHGSYGSPEGNWFPWLKKELNGLGYEVFVPQFPTPENQSLENWEKIIENYSIDGHTLLIGHSLGASFILSLLEKHKCKAAFLVSGFVDLLDNPEFDTVNKSFVRKEFDWKTILSHCSHFFIFHGSDDPYVPLPLAEKVAQHLYTKLIVIENGKHLNKEAGYKEFPLLLSKIKEVAVTGSEPVTSR